MASCKVKSFAKTVSTAATAVPLSATALVVYECVIRADPENEGNIYIGDSTGQVYPIQPGEPFRIADLQYTRISPRKNEPSVNLADVYIHSDFDGEGVYVAYIHRS